MSGRLREGQRKGGRIEQEEEKGSKLSLSVVAAVVLTRWIEEREGRELDDEDIVRASFFLYPQRDGSWRDERGLDRREPSKC